MSVNFNETACQVNTDKKLFGICDDTPPPHKPAYIDEQDGKKWIAVVVNDDRHTVTFTAIDHCIKMIREDGKPAKQCDGLLTYNDTVIFIELKESNKKGNDWVKEAEKQLKTTIHYFESSAKAINVLKKKAYIANRKHPRFKENQSRRMNQFLIDTGYVLRIENRIVLD